MMMTEDFNEGFHAALSHLSLAESKFPLNPIRFTAFLAGFSSGCMWLADLIESFPQD
jgi:hypothetical protein